MENDDSNQKFGFQVGQDWIQRMQGAPEIDAPREEWEAFCRSIVNDRFIGPSNDRSDDPSWQDGFIEGAMEAVKKIKSQQSPTEGEN